MSARDDLSLERIEAVRFALGYKRDIHAVCDMAGRWLSVIDTVQQFASSHSTKDFIKLLRAIRAAGQKRAHPRRSKRAQKPRRAA